MPQRSATAAGELADTFAVSQVEGGNRRGPAAFVDAVLDLLERGASAGDQDDMGAGSAIASAVAAPMPRLAPVTSAVRPPKRTNSFRHGARV